MTQHFDGLGIGASFDLVGKVKEVVETILVALDAPLTAATLSLVGGSLVEGCDGKGGLFEGSEKHAGSWLFGVIGGGVAAGESRRE